MSAAAAPRLGGGFFASVLFHGALVAAFFALRPPPAPPTPPLYRVQLFAAPPGQRAVGVVQEPQPAPVTPTPVPPSTGQDSVYSILEVDVAVVRAANSAAPAYPLKLLQQHVSGSVAVG